jgi:hypothetical protein
LKTELLPDSAALRTPAPCRGQRYYAVDRNTGDRESLGTDARRAARNEIWTRRWFRHDLRGLSRGGRSSVLGCEAPLVSYEPDDMTS